MLVTLIGAWRGEKEMMQVLTNSRAREGSMQMEEEQNTSRERRQHQFHAQRILEQGVPQDLIAT